MSTQPLQLAFDLRRLLAWRPPTLRFDPIEEAHFQHTGGPARLTHFANSGALALFIYNLFLLADRVMIPDVFDLAVQLRLCMFTPFAMLLLLLGWRFRPFLLLLPVSLMEGVLAMTGIVAALSLGWLLSHSGSDFAGMYTAGLVPIIIYGNLVQRFRFRFALAFSMSVVGVALACVWSRFGHGHAYAVFDIPLALLVMLISAYTLIMNYRFELEERRRFQWSVRAQTLHKQLAASQAQLEEMSRLDPLTGVPNRRHFDAYIRQSWDAALQRGEALALLLIDVDHFKAFNDRYGHPAGDQCLKHVAKALQQQVPQALGCVARWGGEEFIVVLPDADAARAMKTAQGLCEAVSGLGLRHEASATSPSVTISVGVAVTRPAAAHGAGDGAVVASVDGLVAAADVALYRAKEGGRNRAMAALSPVPG